MSSFKVRFKREAPEVALIQMRAEDHVKSCIRNLDGIFLSGMTVTIRRLPDMDLKRFEGTFSLWNETSSYMDFGTCKYLRFLCTNSDKNRKVAPSKVTSVTLCFGFLNIIFLALHAFLIQQTLHFFNVSPYIMEEDISLMLVNCGGTSVVKVEGQNEV
jgi:hypothetical protein